MNELNNKCVELNVEDLQDINGGSFLPYLGGAIAIYDGVSDFTNGFVDEMMKPY